MKTINLIFLAQLFVLLVLTTCERKEIVSRTFPELTSNGWKFNWFPPSSYTKPSDWRAALKPLDSDVTDGSVWRVMSTPIHFRKHIDPCVMTNVTVRMKYFLENSGMIFYPCRGVRYCHLDPDSNGVMWKNSYLDVHVGPYETEITILMHIPIGSGGYLFFDEITVEYSELDGTDCSTSTENPTNPTPTGYTETEPETTTTELTTELSSIPTELPSTTEDTTEYSTSTTEDPPTTTETPDPNSCNHDCEYRPVSCHVYYTCVNFTYKEYHTCAHEDGLAFNPILKTCDLIGNVEGCQPPTTVPPPENCVCEYRADEMDCSKYYYCPDTCNEILCERRACPSGLIWTVDLYGDGSNHQQCTWPEDATCLGADANLEFSCKRKVDGIYRNLKDCHSFWKCVNGQPLLYDCTKGMIYNPEILKCDFPGKAIRFCENS